MQLALRIVKGRRGRGRQLVRAIVIGTVELHVGDRLEPSPDLPDTALVESRPLPFTAVFWRATLDGRGRLRDPVVHRNPLFGSRTGLEPRTVMGVDALHTVYYGPLMRWTAAVLWRIVLANGWGFTGSQEEILEQAARAVRAELFQWYANTRVPHDRRIGDFNLKILGSRQDCTVGGRRQHPGCGLKVKAAEAGMLFDFARHLLAAQGASLPHAENLAAAGAAMNAWLAITRRESLVLSAQGSQGLRDQAQRHLQHAARACIDFVPKYHFYAELSIQAENLGNPKAFATWTDEGLNLRLRNAAAAAHAARQEDRVFHWLSLQAALGLAPALWGDSRQLRELGLA